MPIQINFDEIKPRLTQNSLILTPNLRTQQALVSSYMNSLAVGDVVKAPIILSFSQWQNQLWQELLFVQPLPKMVSPIVLKMWLKTQIDGNENWQLTNSLGVAEKIISGYRDLSAWNKSLLDLESLETPENEYFCIWIEQLEAFCKDKNIIVDFNLILILIKSFEKIKNKIPNKILLVGFNQVTPAEDFFLNCCKTENTSVEFYFPKINKPIIKRIDANDFSHEVEQAAARAKLITQDFPDKTIAVVVNQLSDNTSLVHQIFDSYFQIDDLIPWKLHTKSQYNVSAGQVLIELPIIAAAIGILNLNASGFELNVLKFLKNTPFIHWGEHDALIKKFIHKQCLLGYPVYTISHLLHAIEKSESPEHLELLKQRIESLQNKQAARKIADWVEYWKYRLNQWGWLGSENINDEYSSERLQDDLNSSIAQLFYESFKKCSDIDLLFNKLSYSQAKEYLLQILKAQSFQMPSDRTNVHVLGMLEATGLLFDELILVGFNRKNWPAKAKANPFLPLSFQKENDMPGSSAEREYRYAEGISGSLMTAAENIFITQSQFEDDVLSPESSFFSQYPLLENGFTQLTIKHPMVKADYRWRRDDKIKIIQGGVKGGAYLLSHYSTCPFQALTKHYLKVTTENNLLKGIQPTVKGSWLHSTMEFLWLELREHQALIKLSADALDDLVDNMLSKAQKEYQSQLTASAADEVIQIEFAKLKKQILTWLEIDKNRTPFTVSTEVEKSLTIGELPLTFRIDRIDINDANRLEIIDYKTGDVDVKKWLSKRPEEAQMPAYLLACDDADVESLSYAKIKTGETLRVGVWFDENNQYQFIEQDEEKTKDKTERILRNKQLIDTDLELAVQWRLNLESLAKNIVSGEMPVSPKKEIISCRYCDYSNFCRIAEEQPADNAISDMSEL